MSEIHELAGKPQPVEWRLDVPRLITEYYTRRPDPDDAAQRVSFGTSGHRGSAFKCAFNEWHILAITQAICEVRAANGVTGPLFLGVDTHALSEPARASALEVLAANGVHVVLPKGRVPTPTPVISHAILRHNARPAGAGARGDGIVVTPSHNPPEDGGFKYNPPTGGPADTGTTKTIEDRANQLLRDGLSGVKRIPVDRALAADTTTEQDFHGDYVADLGRAIDMEAIARSGISIGVDPLGGAAIALWDRIAEKYGLKLEVVNRRVDPTFAFMPLDHDGKIRMDCSSRYAMTNLIALRERFDVAFGTDTDADRHGIVTRKAGLLEPNRYLAVAIEYLFRSRTGWPAQAAIGKTLVSSATIDRVAKELGRRLAEVPVGFKWFVEGLLTGGYGFGGEESAGASFLCRDGSVWTTDKDGLLLGLLAAEITALTKRDPGQHYEEIEQRLGRSYYRRTDAPATREQQAKLKALSPDSVTVKELGGEPVTAVLSNAPENGAPLGGIKVSAANGWFAARPSGTELVYKIYAESFRGPEHLASIEAEARDIVAAALR